MTEIDVVGGVYGERCSFPCWDAIFGSAGRAATAISPYVDEVRLHSVVSTEAQRLSAPIFDSFGVDMRFSHGDQFIGFDYLHCLATPQLSPSQMQIKQQPSFQVEADVAILFGMMECAPTVKANKCVYDPQSPSNPKSFRSTNSKAKHLAIVANSKEIKALTGLSISEGAMKLISEEEAEVVVAKCGLAGARIFDKSGEIGSVPAYETKSVFTIGSGDIFVAAFALGWAVEGIDPVESAEYASRAVAQYVETSALPLMSISDSRECKREAIELSGGNIYLAGPFRELGQRVIINEARQILTGLGMTVFSPVHDIGHGPAEIVVKQDLEALENCDGVLAILNGSSPGTVFEVGWAVARGKPVFCVAQNMSQNDMKLPSGAGCAIHSDFVTALHLIAWRS